MNNFTTNLYDCLIKNNNLEIALKELIRESIEVAINELLKSELKEVLKYEHTNSSNYRNGYYSRDFSISYGVFIFKLM